MLKFPHICRFCLIPNQLNSCIKIFDDDSEIPVKILELTNVKTAQCAPPFFAPISSNSVSPGSDLAKDFNRNMGVVFGNLQNGVTSVATPPIKFGLDTIPSIISYGIQTAADKASKLVEAKQDALSKVVAGVGHVVGGGGVLGSSLAGGALQVIGHGLDASANVAQNTATAGIDLAASLADKIVAGTEVNSNITRAALNALGDSMTAAGGGVTVVSQGLSNVIDAVGERISQRISKAKETATALLGTRDDNMKQNALSVTSKAQVTFYNLLNSYLQILVNVQNLFDGIALTIRPDQSPLVTEDKNTPASGVKATSNSTSSSFKSKK